MTIEETAAAITKNENKSAHETENKKSHQYDKQHIYSHQFELIAMWSNSNRNPIYNKYTLLKLNISY